MGGADIVPGVSGGTMALILGIYPRLIRTLRDLTAREFLTALARFNWRRVLASFDWRFLLALGIGIGTSVLTLAGTLEWLLVHQRSLLFSFFFGLILASVFTVSRRVKRWRSAEALGFAGAAIIAFVIVGLTPASTPEAGWFLFLSGALAICALVLPGISGAFVLVLLGKYDAVLGALTGGDLLTLATVAAGAVTGLLSFVRLLAWLLDRFLQPTLAILAGFMFGSLRKVWPWQQNEGGLATPTLPSLEGSSDLYQLGLATVLAAIGLAVVLIAERIAPEDR